MPIDTEGLPEDLKILYVAFQNEIEAIYSKLYDGVLSVDEWRNAMRDSLSKHISSAYMLGKKQGKLAENDLIKIYNQLRSQVDYLDGFTDAIHALEEEAVQAGLPRDAWRDYRKIPWKAWKNRAEMYTGAIVSPYWQGTLGDLPLPAVPGDLTSQCGQGCRCGWRIVPLPGDDPGKEEGAEGNYDCYWVLDPRAEHCQTCLERSENWNPLKVRGWELILPDYKISTHELKTLKEAILSRFKGGEGSGNFDHEGRPGEVGGSAPKRPALYDKLIKKAKLTYSNDMPKKGQSVLLSDGTFAYNANPQYRPHTLIYSALILSNTDKFWAGIISFAKGALKRPDTEISLLEEEAQEKLDAISCEASHWSPEITFKGQLGADKTKANRIWRRIKSAISNGKIDLNGIEVVWFEVGGKRFSIEAKDIDSVAGVTNSPDNNYEWMVITKGGKGSGNFGHAGRVGKVGGSGPAGYVNPVTLPAFKKWFGDSKVVNADGTPRVVYHGTRSNFTVFDINKGGSMTDAPSATLGFFFAGRHWNADIYSEMAKPEEAEAIDAIYNEAMKLRKSWLRSRNLDDPKVKAKYNRSDELFRQAAEMRSSGGNIMPVYLKAENPFVYDMKGKYYREESFFDLITRAKEKGYDSVIIKNTYDAGNKGDGKPDDVFVVFKPTQIKSALGNQGTYDPDNPDILKGGKGSGNFQHAGRKGKVGGSAPAESGPAWIMAKGKNEEAHLTDYHPEAQRLEWIHPLDYFAAVRRDIKQANPISDRSYINEESVEKIKKRMRERLPLDAAFVDVDLDSGKIINQEGRHRALAAFELGIDTMPVIVYFRKGGRFADITQGENKKRAAEIMPFPSILTTKGGKGSGNFGHAGRPGMVGGSIGGNSGRILAQSVKPFITHIESGDPQPEREFIEASIKSSKVLSDRALSILHVEDEDHIDSGFLKVALITRLSDRANVDFDTVSLIVKQWAYTSNDSSYFSSKMQEWAAKEFGVELSYWQKGNLEQAQEAHNVDIKALKRAYKIRYAEYLEHAQEPQDELITVREMIAGAEKAKAANPQAGNFDWYINTLSTRIPELENLIGNGKTRIDVAKQKAKEAILEKIRNDMPDMAAMIDGRVTETKARRVLRAMYDETQDMFKGAGIKEIVLFRGVKDIIIERKNNDPWNFEPVQYEGNAMESWSGSYSTAREFSGYHGNVLAAVFPVSRIIASCVTGYGCFNEREFVVIGNNNIIVGG